MSAQTSEKKHRGSTNLRPPWQPGQSGNPNGRPPGSRQLIAGEFLTDALADWKENGKAAFAALATEKPEDYLRLMAEVAKLTAKAGNEREPTVIDARPVFDLSGLLSRIATGDARRSEPRLIPERSVLAADGGAGTDGRSAPVDSGQVPGGGE